MVNCWRPQEAIVWFGSGTSVLRREIGKLVGHAGTVWSVAWLPDNRRVITAGKIARFGCGMWIPKSKYCKLRSWHVD